MLFHFFNLVTLFLLMIVLQKPSDPVNLATFAEGSSLLQLKTYFFFNLLNSSIDLLIALFQHMAGLRQKKLFSLVNYNILSHYCYLPSQLLFLYLIQSVFVCIIFQKRFAKKIFWHGGSYFLKRRICSCAKYLALPSDVCKSLSNI